MTSASALEYRSRYELVEEARSLGVERPERMTMQELKDEILRLTLSEEEQQGARGLFGVARAMLAGVVEAGLKMPEAARVIRGDVTLDLPTRSRSPVATVTLAEIYAAQGHPARALAVLDEVLSTEPDHEEALRIRRALSLGDSALAEPPPSRQSSTPVSIHQSEMHQPEMHQSDMHQPDMHQSDMHQPDPAGEFPSTEYVPALVVETTGHESTEGRQPDAREVPAREVPAIDEAPVTAEPASAEEPAAEVPTNGRAEEPWSGPILAAEQRGSTLCLYWELSPASVSRSGLDEGEGSPALAVVAFTPSGQSPLREQRILPLAWHEPFAGTVLVSDLGPHAAVRAAVGWVLEGTFLPLAVGRTLARLASESPAAAARADAALDALLPRT
jgi:hypothetical protein